MLGTTEVISVSINVPSDMGKQYGTVRIISYLSNQHHVQGGGMQQKNILLNLLLQDVLSTVKLKTNDVYLKYHVLMKTSTFEILVLCFVNAHKVSKRTKIDRPNTIMVL